MLRGKSLPTDPIKNDDGAVPWSAAVLYDNGRCGRVGLSSRAPSFSEAVEQAKAWCSDHSDDWLKRNAYLKPSFEIRIGYRNIFERSHPVDEYFTIPEGKEPTAEFVEAIMDEKYTEKSAKFPTMFPDDAAQREDWKDFVRDSFMSHERAKAGVALDTVPYTRELDDIGSMMTVEEWKEDCETGALIDYDGFGHPIRADHVPFEGGMDPTKYPTVQFRMSDMNVSPSLRHLMPKDATHIMWYNR